jgi:hypothetical protein
MQGLIRSIRTLIGLELLRWALRVLPLSAPEARGTRRGLREQWKYERYAAYCGILKKPALPFDNWREQEAWQQVKAAGAR